ncbi:MAG: hypothetical protein WCE27_14725, partial [Pseudolabrys sp.]
HDPPSLPTKREETARHSIQGLSATLVVIILACDSAPLAPTFWVRSANRSEPSHSPILGSFCQKLPRKIHRCRQIVELSVQVTIVRLGWLLRAQQIAANDCQKPLDDNKSHSND